jgi:stage II sporulation protein P
MKGRTFKSLILYLVAIILVIIILSQISNIFKTVGEKRENSLNDYQLAETKTEVITTELSIGEPEYESEHDEADKTFGSGLYRTLFSPKKILSYQLPFLTAVDVETQNKDIEKSIFRKNKDSEIITSIKGLENDEMINIELSGDGPNILIYHTHTTESFRMKFDGEYNETTAWRTSDEDYNVVGLGSMLNRLLTSNYGYNVIHDKTNHEPPKLSTAYSRSLDTMDEYKDDHKDLKVYMDVHRDAADVVNDVDDVVYINGERCAKIMFVVGTGKDFNNKPNWENNYKLALAITNELNEINPNFAKPIRLKDGRYNQHISDACVLIEIGHNANTFSDAKNSIPYLAKAIDNVLSK